MYSTQNKGKQLYAVFMALALLFGNPVSSETITDALLSRAQAAYDAGQFKKASSYYLHLIKKEPNNMDHRYRLARVYFALSNNTQAYAMIDEILQINAGYVPAVHEHGKRLQQAGNLEAAIIVYDSILQSSPDHTDVLLSLVGALESSNDQQRANEVYQHYLSLDSAMN